jgi:hypothetical protein
MSTIAELQALHLPRMTWRDVLSPVEGAEPPSAEDQHAMDIYFGHFVTAKDDDGHLVCVRCRNRIRGGIEGFLMGGAPGSTSMEWGLVHGECFCVRCKWPARAYHFDIGRKDDPLIKRMSLMLQYHPDECIERKPEV